MSEQEEVERQAALFSRLILRAQRGDLKAFDEIKKKCLRRTHSLCTRLLGEVGADATVAAFDRAWRSIGTFGTRKPFRDTIEEKRAFESWLLQIATRVCWNIKRVNEVETTVFDDGQELPLPPVPGVERQVIDGLSADRFLRMIWECEKTADPRWDPLTLLVFEYYCKQAIDCGDVDVEAVEIAERVKKHRTTVTDRVVNRIRPVVRAALKRLKDEDDAV